MIVTAGANELDEVWVAEHPALLLGYLVHYAPSVAKFMLKYVGNDEATVKVRKRRFPRGEGGRGGGTCYAFRHGRSILSQLTLKFEKRKLAGVDAPPAIDSAIKSQLCSLGSTPNFILLLVQ